MFAQRVHVWVCLLRWQCGTVRVVLLRQQLALTGRRMVRDDLLGHPVPDFTQAHVLAHDVRVEAELPCQVLARVILRGRGTRRTEMDAKGSQQASNRKGSTESGHVPDAGPPGRLRTHDTPLRC